MGLPKTGRLTHRDNFSLIKKNGRKVFTRYFVFYFLENARQLPRLGVVVSAKFGGSVVRHRVKRLFREAFRRHTASFRLPVDVIIIPNKEIKEKLAYGFVESVFAEGLEKAGLLDA